MLKKLFVASLLSLSTLISRAQHCPWDGSSFIMVAPPAAVEIQTIQLVDSNGVKVTSKWYSGYDSIRVDTAVFWKNADIDPQDQTLRKRTHHYKFAGENYVLSFGQFNRDMRYQLRVIYKDGTKIKEVLIPLPHKEVHPLCTSNKELWEGKIKPLDTKL